MTTLGQLVQATAGQARIVRGAAETPIAAITTDSRTARAGSLFAALAGKRSDGHRHLAAAAAAGAAALLIEPDGASEAPRGPALLEAQNVRRALGAMADRFFGHPSGELALVGVTGTNGKTTVTWLLDAIARAAGRPSGVIGTIANRFVGREEPAGNTTPEAPELQRLLREMADAGVRVVALEASSHALELERLVGCSFAAAVFTNFGRDHLDFHPDLEAYFAAKRKLFTAFPVGTSVINLDDPRGAALAAAARGRVVSYGSAAAAADVRAARVESDADGVRFAILAEGRRTPVASPLIGGHNVLNVLAAAAAARALQIPWEAIQAGVAACGLVPGRFERVGGAGCPLVLVDYAHTPEAVENALRVARPLGRGRLAVVLGCGGDRDRGKRPLMGAAAARLADRVYLTSDNPRSEPPGAIIDEMFAGARAAGGSAGLVVIEDRRAAIRQAVAEAAPEDVVVIAGKGHEDTQTVGERALPFSDREEARRALEEARCRA